MRLKSSEKVLPALKKDISKLHRRGVLSGKEIVVFGCSLWSVHIKKVLETAGYKITAFVDNNPQKVGIRFLDTEVFAPMDYLVGKDKNTVVLVCNASHKVITSQLITFGYQPEKHSFKVGYHERTRRQRRGLFIQDTSFISFLINSLRFCSDYSYYRSWRKKYGASSTIFVTPHGAGGEVYISGLLFQEYLKCNGIEEYVFIVPGKLAQNTAKIFQIQNNILIKKVEIYRLLRVAQMLGFLKSSIKPLFYGATRVTSLIPSNTQCELRHTFLDAYKYDVYGLDADQRPSKPIFANDTDLIKRLFTENSLEKGKTVILSPYVGTFDSGIPKEFWERLVQKLQEVGFCVCTNSAGEHEPAIQGTTSVFFELIHAVPVMEYAGFFVGQRSGLCDIVSSAKCKMVVIYESGIRTNRMDYFGLKNMGLNGTANELLYCNANNRDVIDSIMDGFEEKKE